MFLFQFCDFFEGVCRSETSKLGAIEVAKNFIFGTRDIDLLESDVDECIASVILSIPFKKNMRPREVKDLDCAV